MDDGYTFVEVGSEKFKDLDENEPISVVDGSWYYEGDFPGTQLDYSAGLFYSSDFDA